jgi:hypothetical protein
MKTLRLKSIEFDTSDNPSAQGAVYITWLKGAADEHRLLIDVDTDIAAMLAADAYTIEAQGFERPPAGLQNLVSAVTDFIWTPKVRATVKAAKDAEREQMVADLARASEAEQKRFDDAVAAAVARLSKKN